jgi:cytochrome c-type biogenesis protein CcmF
MIGQIVLIINFVLAIASAITFFASYKDQNSKLATVARGLFQALFTGIIFAAAFLMFNIITHNFEYNYIWSYSNTELSFGLLMSTFYAGQEGSFLLWLVMLAIIGSILQPNMRKHGYESQVMGVFSILLAFVTLMLVLKSPFTFVWEAFPELNEGFMPKEGRGLNPILENIWIIIHPPILFAGYALTTVPYALAIAGLIKKDYTGWTKLAIPWTLSATAVLGLGIMLGGFWAYESLGWGGFWGWDPVENSSLLPWLIAVALVHTLLIQKRTKGLVKTNFILAILTFVFVVYATFLTRSGILGDMSVHSFSEPENSVYWALVGFLVTFLLGGIFFVIYRARDLLRPMKAFSIMSKESAMTIGAILVLASMVIIFAGTSLPIFKLALGMTKSGVDISFYDQWNLPIVFLMLIINAISVYMSWKTTDMMAVLKKIAIMSTAAFVMTFVTYYIGINSVQLLLLAFSAWFSLFISAEMTLKMALKNLGGIGAFVSHFGLSLFILGVIATAGFTEHKTVSFQQGESVEALGYTFTYTRYVQIQTEKKDREKYEFYITAEKNGMIDSAAPIFYWSDFNQRKQAFMEPGISRTLMQDIYISPSSIEQVSATPSIAMTKGHKVSIPSDDSLMLEFKSFDMSHAMQTTNDSSFKLAAVVEYQNGEEAISDTIYAEMVVKSGILIPEWKTIPGTTTRIGFVNFYRNTEDMANSQALFAFLAENEEYAKPSEKITVDIAIKRFINFAWAGVILLVLGFFLSMGRHRKNKTQ